MERDWYSRLLDAITIAQSQLVGRVKAKPLFEGLLQAMLELAESEYGFIGEVLNSEDGKPYLKTYAITNIAWDRATQQFYEENSPSGLEFRNLDTLFGYVLTNEDAVIANAPYEDPRRGGVPAGHPPLNKFLGIPLHSGGEMVGMVGVANRKGGYDEQLVNQLQPFLQTCANAIFALRTDLARVRAEDKLEDEERMSKAILDSSNEAIITIDESGSIESFNRKAESMFGYSADEVRGESARLLVPERYLIDNEEQIRSFLESKSGHLLSPGREIVGRRRNGTEFPVEISFSEITVRGRRLFTGLIRDLTEREDAAKQLKSLEEELQRSRFGQMIGASPSMKKLYRAIEDVSKGGWTVIVEGETGVGKELVARATHAASENSEGPFIAVNCAGLTDSLLESQLFGHRRGAFSGAIRDQDGFFSAADGGTIFLDEIGDISPSVQTSLLRVLQEGEFVRVGDTKPTSVNVRVIAATNRSLEQEVKAGRFREDLYFRLRVARLAVPPLREREKDITLLAEACLAEARISSGKAIGGFEQSAIKCLQEYAWPGNVRELRNTVLYAVMHCKGRTIGVSDLPPELTHSVEGVDGQDLGAEDAQQSEEQQLRDALELANGNRTKAAKLLGISRATFYRKLNKASPGNPLS